VYILRLIEMGWWYGQLDMPRSVFFCQASKNTCTQKKPASKPTTTKNRANGRRKLIEMSAQNSQGIQTLLEAEKDALKIVARARLCMFVFSTGSFCEKKRLIWGMM